MKIIILTLVSIILCCPDSCISVNEIYHVMSVCFPHHVCPDDAPVFVAGKVFNIFFVNNLIINQISEMNLPKSINMLYRDFFYFDQDSHMRYQASLHILPAYRLRIGKYISSFPVCGSEWSYTAPASGMLFSFMYFHMSEKVLSPSHSTTR